MSDHLRNALRRALLRLLDPLTRLMLEVGIGAGEFHRLTKESYVRSARQMLGGERPNFSRLAVVTGLTRSEVTEIVKNQAAADEPESHVPPAEERIGAARAERVLRGWWNDSQYQEYVGKPAILPLKGPRGSFQALVSYYAGGPKARAVLQELLRVNAVRLLPGDKIEALSRTTTTVQWDPRGIDEVGERIRDLIETLRFNLKNPMRPRFVRFVESRAIDPKYLPVLKRDFTNYTDTLADSLQETLDSPQHTLSPGRRPKPGVRLGMGFYLIEEPTTVDPKKSKRRRMKDT